MITFSKKPINPNYSDNGNLPRFIKQKNYSQNFGYQWNKWDSLLSDSRNPALKDHKRDLILKRTHFHDLETKGKTILECGCGGGDDTEVLLSFPFSEIHSFDLSNGVERAHKYLQDERLILSQASIFEIPYEDGAFDFVYCHRVLQHTPNPELALRSISKKVKKGGYLFAHSYHASKNYLRNFKYKYRPLTKRLPKKLVEWFLEYNAGWMHKLIKRMYPNKKWRSFAYRYIPLAYSNSFANFSEKELIELGKLVTFDALTPAYDLPMKWEKMKEIVESEGFEIIYSHPNPKGSPIYLTARKK